VDLGGIAMKPPRATYRLQFTREFGFAAAARLAPYLAALGVSHVYASPYLRARPGSTHGYDIVAHDELNPELGGEPEFAAMVAEFKRHGLEQILDFVPNHMGVGGADNPLWLDVLEWGQDSPFAGWFDIDWEPVAGYLAEKLLVPVLDDQYGAALEDGKLVLEFDARAGTFAVWAYHTHKLPIHPPRYAAILGSVDPALERIGDEFSALREWRPQMHRRAADLQAELSLLIATNAEARAALDAALKRLNGAQDPQRRELSALIDDQYWRASHFRVAGDDINYRRFFNINDLAGLRIELPDVFEHAHRLVVRLLREGAIAGLRIDHIDGLLDPTDYLRRLRALALRPDGASRPFYLVVEKILARDEPLRRDWPVEGTTGYEFANLALRVLTNPAGEAALTQAYAEHAGERSAFGDVVRESKMRILRNEMSSELNVLARDAARVARQNPRTADFTRNILRRAIRQTIACFPVYRTYLDAGGELAPEDRKRILAALEKARMFERDVDPSVFDFLEMLLTGDLAAAPRSGFSRHAALRCAMKFQQLSGPVMAKGLEDTAFYRYNRLISHNEVGGDPAWLAATIEEFHEQNAERARRTPHALLATATHDTKRGEDVRARLAVLAEIPAEWSLCVAQWRRVLATHSANLADRNLEYLLYQTLIGSWPIEPMTEAELQAYRARLEAAAIKSAREARAHTSWARPHEAFESGIRQFLDAALVSREFRASFEPLAARIAAAGARKGLVQTVLKLTVPGVPDIYQGTECWDLSLVDPDNRRPVDYARRNASLETLLADWRRDGAGTVRRAWQEWTSGRIKMLTIALLLAHRRENSVLYETGGYRQLATDGGLGAFVRESHDASLAVFFERFPLGHGNVFFEQPGAGAWRNLLTRELVSGDVEFPRSTGELPVLVLERI
jgi:(1->4)-alpha-D-glucan 1-alpha-D-glucosylmutase